MMNELNAKKILLLSNNTSEENIFYLKKPIKIVSEGGEMINTNKFDDFLKWKNILSSPLKLGKCGELYAQHLLESMGYEVFEPFVDDHGIDFLAKKSKDKKLLIQVKTVKAGNYTYIKSDKFHRRKDFIVFYIRVDNNGFPSVFVYPSQLWPVENESENTYTYKKRFSFRPFSGKNHKSKAEYGISGANMYYKVDDEFSVTKEDLWECDEEKFNKIVFGDDVLKKN